jgi:TPR repeat protein
VTAWLLALALTLAVPALAQDDPFARGMMAANAHDFAEAILLWRPLADAGDARASYYLAMADEAGEGAPTDEVEAARYYRLAAQGGHAEAANALAVLLIEGRGVPANPAAAWAWFALAAERGSGFAAVNRDKLGAGLNAQQQAAAQALLAQLR